MNHLFVDADNKRLRASVLCEHFFTIADIWSFVHSNIDYNALLLAKTNVDLKGHPLKPDELAVPCLSFWSTRSLAKNTNSDFNKFS